jgi:hypothetical protein
MGWVLNPAKSARAKKDGLARRAALSIAHYETKRLGFTCSYGLCLVSRF